MIGDDPREAINESLTAGSITTHKLDLKKEGTFISKTIDEETHFLIQSLWVDSQGDIDDFKNQLEEWFDEIMKRTTGWYKKYCQVVLFFIGFMIALSFNVDTILIVKKLSKDPELREQLVQQANAFVEAHPNLNEEFEFNKQEILATNNADTAKVNEIKTYYDSLKVKQDSLLSKANRLVEKDISNVNSLLGLGWDTSCANKKECNCVCIPVSYTHLTLPTTPYV